MKISEMAGREVRIGPDFAVQNGQTRGPGCSLLLPPLKSFASADFKTRRIPLPFQNSAVSSAEGSKS